MGLRDKIKDHPVIIVAGAFAAGISIGWTVANSVLVEPRNFEIVQLREQLSKTSALRQDLMKAQETISSFKKDIEIVQGIFEVFSDTFDDEVIKADMPVLILFSASWNTPGTSFMPVFLMVYSEYRGRVKFGWVRYEKGVRIFKKYDISIIPQIVLFKDGRIVNRKIGRLSKEELVSFIDRNL